MDFEELLRQLQANPDEGLLNQIYRVASISPNEILVLLRDLGFKINYIHEAAEIPTEKLEIAAEKIVSEARFNGALSGASFGLGGLISVAPEMIYLLVSVVRLGQRLSLVYGYEFSEPKGQVNLWSTLARGLDIQVDREGAESDLQRGLPVLIGRGQFRDPVLLKMVQKVLVAVGIRLSTRVTRLVPLVGAGVSGVTNFAWLTRLGRRLKRDFETQHQLRRLEQQGAQLSEDIQFTLDR